MSWRRTTRTFVSRIALVAALAGLFGGVVVATPAYAAEAEPAYVVLVQTATPAPPTAVSPGNLVTFTYTINCSSDVAACVDLTVSDTLPAPLVLENVSMSSSSAEGNFVTTANSFVLTFTNDLGGGQIGLPDGYSVEFIATARVPADASADFDGATITNTAAATLAYDESNTSADAAVLLAVPTVLDSGVDASVTPTAVNAVVGTEVDYRLRATNDSNTAVDALVIQYPATVGVSPFSYLTPSDLTVAAWPTGADRLRVDWYDGSGWQVGTPSASPTLPVPGGGSSIQGLRFTFTSSTGGTINRDAAGEVVVGSELVSSVESIVGSATVNTTTSSWVVFESASSTPVTDPVALRIDEVSVSPVASKNFTPSSVVGGDDVEVTLRAENGGDYRLARLTVTEPASGQPDLLDQGLEFQGWNDADVEWPVGATSAEVSYWYDGDADFSAATTVAASSDLPDPAAGDVRGVRVVFLGDMPQGQYAVLPYVAIAQTVVADVTTTNTISVDAVTTGSTPLSASTTATDDLTRRSARVDAFVVKTASPSSLYAVPGATSVLSIVAGVSPQPSSPADTGGSTVGASRLVVTDPVGAGSGFWEDFSLGRILSTDVPSGSTLTVQYLDASGTPTWTTIGSPTTGPATYSRVLTTTERDQMGGIRFVYEPDGQPDLRPGFTVGINLRVNLRSAGIDADATAPSAIDNVVEATVENPAATPALVSEEDPATLLLTPVSGGSGSGTGLDLVGKEWQDTLVDARSGDTAQATITWGTGGLGFDSIVVTDSATDPAAPAFDVADTVYDAFDLVRISASEDPLLTYDAITAVQLYIPGSGWVPTASNPCAASACDGAFPGYTLTASERANAVAVRLVFEESPTRAARVADDDPYAPPIGSGVASTTPRERDIDLDFRLRDTRRSNGDPVLGSNRGTVYNTSSAGEVSNSVLVEGLDATGAVLYSDRDDAVIQIVDRALNVTVTKTWTGGPLGVPADGTPAPLFPQARVTLTGTNATVVPVDSLALTEPGVVGTGAAPEPFDAVDLADIVSISVPAGTASTSVILGPSSSYPTPYALADALALTAIELADATSIRIVHTGRIEAGGQTVVVLDTRLRDYRRSDPGTRVGIADSPLSNSVLAEVGDLGGLWAGLPEDAPAPGEVLTASDDAAAQMTISNPVVEVTATKVITADTASTAGVAAIQYGDSSPTAMVRLTGQPGGNVRYTEMIFVDDTATFWNAYAFTAFSSHTFASPIDQVQVDAFVDADYTAGPGNTLVTTGGHWENGVPRSSLALPTGVLPGDILGLRITYSRADGSSWERPFNPLQAVQFTVTRRGDLLSGGAVPSTIYVDAPGIAPGESDQATFTDTVQVTVNARATSSDPVLYTASESATAQIRYQHLPANVEVRTSPTGSIALGDTVAYRIAVRNSGGAGDKTLSGVVVTDLLPVDGLGSPYLVFPSDPDDDHVYDPNVPADAAEIFGYELRNASNVLQPAPNVTVALDTVETSVGSGVFQPRLTFTVADDIPLGWTVTITADLEFRAQLEAGTPVVTEARVTSDQEFDSCGVHYVDDAATSDIFVETESCFSTTTVSPLPSAPLTVAKGVKGIEAGPLDDAGAPLLDGGGDPYDDLGVMNVSATSTLDCSVPNTTLAVNGGGYYRYPCVPITRPGATEEWASSFVNSGNVSVRQIVAIDVLPRPGDTGVTIPTARGSKWTARLTSYPVATGLPSGATLTVYYTDVVGMASARCNGADIQNSMGMSTTSNPPMQTSYQACLTNTAATDEIADRVWTVLPNEPAVWATAVALKFVVTMDDSAGLTNLLGPGGTVAVTYRTSTALAPEIGETTANRGLDSVAYNSIAAAATGRIYESGDPLDLAYRLVNEPRKSGIALAVGQLRILKQNTGPAASYAPSAIDVSLACTVDVDGTPVPIALVDSARADRSTLALTPGTTALVQGIPLYADCTITEADDYGRTTVTVSPSSTLRAQAAPTMAARTVDDPHPVFDEVERPATELATITNDYQSATLVVSKTVDTNGAVNQANQPIVYTAPVFSVTCRFDNGITNATIFSVSNLTIASGNSLSFPRPSTSDPVLPAGSVCTVTETNTRNATTTRYTVTTGAGAGSPTTGTTANVTLTADAAGAATNQVAFANTYGVGSFTVSKAVAGLGGSRYGTGDFTMSVTCTRTSASPTTVWSGTFTLSATDPTERIDNLPAGAVCTVTETDSAGATSTTFSPQQPGVATAGRATVPNGSNTTVTVTNTFDLARLAITKDVRTDAVDASGDPVYPVDTYDIDVTCTFRGAPVTADGYASSPMHLTGIERAEPVTLTGLPAGASCVVQEVNIPSEVDSTSIEWVTSATSGTSATASATLALTRDSSATVGTNQVTVVNRYDVAALTVTKDVRGGAGAQFGVGPFEIAVECIAPGGVTAYDGTITLPTAVGAWQQTIEDLPDGAECSVVETNAGDTGADATRYVDADGDPFDGTGTVVTTADPGSVTIENWYLTGAVTVGKVVTGDAGEAYGDGPFEVTLDCTRLVDGTPVAVTDFPQARTLSDGDATTFTGLPSGAECVLTETNTGGAGSSRIVTAADPGTTLTDDVATGHTFTVTVDPDNLTDDRAQPALQILNSFALAGLVVSKTVQSDAVDASGAAILYGPFPVEVVCTFEGVEVYADGFGPSTPMHHTFADGDAPWVLTGLVAGASCDVTETDRQSAASSRMVATPSGGSTTTFIASPSASEIDTTIVLARRGVDQAENAVAIRNDYESGTIELAKVLDGDGVEWATESFRIDLVCTLPDGPVESTVWDAEYVIDADDLTIPALENVAAGADCTVAESRTGGATSTRIDVGGTTTSGTSASFVSPAGATALPVTVTNVFELADIDVTKVRLGDSDVVARYGVGPFEVTAECTRDVDGSTLTIVIPGGATRVLNGIGMYTAEYVGLPVGADCVLTETRTGGATRTAVTPTTSSLESGSNAVTVTNTFASGSVEVEKVVDGDGTMYATAPFYVTLDCVRDVDGVTVEVEIPAPTLPITGVTDPAVRELSSTNGYRAEYLGLPAEADCEIVESGTGGASSSAIDVSTFTIADGVGQPVTVTNTFLLTELIVTNLVTGNAAAPKMSDDFVIELGCETDVNGAKEPMVIPDGEERDFQHDETVEYEELLVGAVCEITETDDRGANRVTIMQQGVDVDLFTLSLDAAEMDIRVVNVFNRLAATGVSPLLALQIALALLVLGGILATLRRTLPRHRARLRP